MSSSWDVMDKEGGKGHLKGPPPPVPPHITEKSLQEVLSGALLNIATL